MVFPGELWYTVFVRKSEPDDPDLPCSHLTGAAPATGRSPPDKTLRSLWLRF